MNYFELQDKCNNYFSNDLFWTEYNINHMINYIQLIYGHTNSKKNNIDINRLYDDNNEYYKFNICTDYFTNKTGTFVKTELVITEYNYFKFIKIFQKIKSEGI